MSELDVATIDWADCLKHLGEYVRNLEGDPDDYDMLKAATALHGYAREHASELYKQAHTTGWLPLEHIEPETIERILAEAKWKKGK